MKQDGSSDTASLVCFVGAVVLSSFFWFYWLYGVEWVWFRGCVAAQTMFQSLGLLVLMVRDKRMVSRIIILFLIRQICSTFTDWIWRFILDMALHSGAGKRVVYFGATHDSIVDASG